jgi:uncharacterized protein
MQTEPERGVQELKALAEAGSVLAMLHFGWALENGSGTKVDHRAAETWLRRAYEKGSDVAGYYLGHVYLRQRDYVRAQEIFAGGASMNYAPAIYCLGEMYLEGTGIGKQPERAIVMFEKATSLGHVFAKRKLAGMLMSGHLGFTNIVRGLALFIGALKDGLLVGIREGPSSDRFRA